VRGSGTPGGSFAHRPVQGRLEKKLTPPEILSLPPRGGHYSCSLVSFFVDLFLQTSASLRGAASAFAVFVRHFPLALPVPSFTTIRAWVLRLGCYALLRPLPQDTPWLWIIDHTIQIGAQKLFLIVGCPLSDVPFGQRCLSLADLRLVALVPMEQSDQYLIDAELEKGTHRTGTPRLIVSDQGSDLVKGIELFQQRHANTAAVGDIAHHGANVLENRWERDPRWKELLQRFAQTNQQIRQTADAFLLAPTLRNKARFMNVGPLLRFARRLLSLLKREIPNEKAQQRYGWLLEYEEDVARWLEQYDVVEKTIQRVRRHGLNGGTLGELEKAWGAESERPGTKMVRGHMRAYVSKNVRQAQEGETLAGSSEVLESAFGKWKAKTGESGQGELTGMALSLGAILGQHDEEEVRQALEAVPEKKAEGMIARLLGPTLCWLRHQLFGAAKA
jgi:hypothetical protein